MEENKKTTKDNQENTNSKKEALKVVKVITAEEHAKAQKAKEDAVEKKAAEKSAESKPFKKEGRNDRNQNKRKKGSDDGFDHRIIEIRRVTRMYKGGRRLRLSVFVVVGDKNGRVGLGLGKAEDVRSAQEKAISHAKKNLVYVPITGKTIPHEVFHKFKASKVLLKPAAPGTGIVAGSSMRLVVEMAGVSDILGKILGTNNKITNAYAVVQALQSLRATKI